MTKKFKWLSAEGDWWLNAYAWPQKEGPTLTPSPWGRYTYSFREAAESLVARVLNREPGTIDLLLFPILYLYRHYVELATKTYTQELNQLLGRDHKITHKHGLGRWKTMFKLVGELISADPPRFEDADIMVDELIQVDPDSLAFRYPELKDGSPSAPDLEYVNIRRLAEGMAHVYEAIGWIEGVIAHEEELQQAAVDYSSDY